MSGNEDMGGMNAFFNEALSLVPQDEVLALFFVKMEESNAFSSFLEQINSSDYENLTENLKVKYQNHKSFDLTSCFSSRNLRDSNQSTLNFVYTEST